MSFADILNPYGYGGYGPRQRSYYQPSPYTVYGQQPRGYYANDSDDEDDGAQYFTDGRRIYRKPQQQMRRQPRYDDDDAECDCGRPQCPSTIRAAQLQRQRQLQQQRLIAEQQQRERERIIEQQRRAAALQRQRQAMMDEDGREDAECDCGRPQCPSTIRARQHQQQQQVTRTIPVTTAHQKQPEAATATAATSDLDEPSSHKTLTRKQRKRRLSHIKKVYNAYIIQQWWRGIITERRAKANAEAQAAAEMIERENKAATTLQKYLADIAAIVPAKRVATQLGELRKIEARVRDLESEFAPITTRSGGLSIYDDRGRIRRDILAYENGLIKALLSIDGVMTFGSDIVRNRRKELANDINQQLAELDAYRSSGEKQKQSEEDHMEVDAASD